MTGSWFLAPLGTPDKHGRLWRGAAYLLGALAINALLYMSLPLLSPREKPPTLTPFRSLTRLTLPRPAPEREPLSPEILKEKPPPPLPRPAAAAQRAPAAPPEFRPDMPSLDFELNAQLADGPKIAAPPAAPASEPALAQAHSVFRAGEVDEPPQILHMIRPVYPYLARKKGLTGRVLLRLLVDEQGRVRKAEVIEAKPEGVFEESALKAARQWRFNPGRYKNRPVPTEVEVPVEFTL